MLTQILELWNKNYQFIVGSVFIPFLIWALSDLRKNNKNNIKSLIPYSPSHDPVAMPRDIRFRFAKRSDFKNIEFLADYFLGSGHGISKETAMKWHNKNNEIFRIVECRSKHTKLRLTWKFCGYYSLVPITRATYEHLKDGKIQDFQITASAVSDFNDKNVPGIYIMDVMTANDSCAERGCANIVARALLKDLINNLQRILQSYQHIEEVSTIVATPNGKEIVDSAGFRKDINFQNPFSWERWTINPRKNNIRRAAKFVGTFREKSSFRSEYIL